MQRAPQWYRYPHMKMQIPRDMGMHQKRIQGNCSPVAPIEHDVVLISYHTQVWKTTKAKLMAKTQVPMLVASTPGGGRTQRNIHQALKQNAKIKSGTKATVIASRRVSTHDMNISDHMEYI
mmetsp:Transcript_56846/g.165013  ORF Transcript_56846/g.165013 Transcript_56846/m.165013 type:complete len:121 (+) Transcript_56846:873-1235(+)